MINAKWIYQILYVKGKILNRYAVAVEKKLKLTQKSGFQCDAYVCMFDVCDRITYIFVFVSFKKPMNFWWTFKIGLVKFVKKQVPQEKILNKSNPIEQSIYVA